MTETTNTETNPITQLMGDLLGAVLTGTIEDHTK